MPSVSELLRSYAERYDRKAADYAPIKNRPWENFEFSADFAARVGRGLPDNDPRRATLTLIGVKISRMMTVGVSGNASNEAFSDTLGDLIVYLTILEAQSTSPR